MIANLFHAFSPVLTVLGKWTLLLALGWAAHGLLRRSHSRWRVILWRSVFCFTLLLPLLPFFPVSTLTIPLPELPAPPASAAELVSPVASPGSVHVGPSVAAEKPVDAKVVSEIASATAAQRSLAPEFWRDVLLLGWGIGVVVGGLRLIRLQARLSRLQQEAEPVDPELERCVRETQSQLGVRRKIRVRLSSAIGSPFVCGLWKPTILLPRTLTLSPNELSVVLRHEIAHFRRHDLAWCVGWRWLNVLGWFHPLVWKIPAAHSLACEQEADRIASGPSEDRNYYAQTLARLALRVLALPPVETRLTMNGTSQIARRIRHLQEGARTWNWKYSVTGFALIGGLFLLIAGVEFSNGSSGSSNTSASNTFKQLLVVVQDENGKPLEGATIVPDGFRVKGPRRVDGHGWNRRVFGPPEKVTTDREGNAYVKYAVLGVPEEKLYTGDIVFSVIHPDFCTTRLQEFPVDGSANPIRLTRGIHVEISAWFGSDHQLVTDFVPNISGEGLRPEDWQKKENGTLDIGRLAPGGHMLQLMARLPSGEVGFSDTLTFQAEPGKKNSFAMEVKPGIRLEGRIDDRVPRPVKNGRVLICVRPPEFPAWVIPEVISDVIKQHGYPHFWHTYRTIAEDGSFIFESVPPGEVDVIVHGDGFVSKNGGEPMNRVQYDLLKPPTVVTGLVIGVPQPFPLVAPVTRIEVKTEPTATLKVTTKTKSGKPVEGASVYVNPNVMRIQGIFGNMRDSSEAPYRNVPPLRDVVYSGETDKDGRLVLQNLPAVTRHVDLYHLEFELPVLERKGLPHRSIKIELSPGQTKTLDLTLQPKGKEFVGTSK
jgi:beta-lactamase regulating signal transducer with metallopeptidase domain